MNKDLLGWGSNILNALVFIILLLNTTRECLDTNVIISSVIMIGISFIIQIISGIGEND